MGTPHILFARWCLCEICFDSAEGEGREKGEGMNTKYDEGLEAETEKENRHSAIPIAQRDGVPPCTLMGNTLRLTLPATSSPPFVHPPFALFRPMNAQLVLVGFLPSSGCSQVSRVPGVRRGVVAR